MKEKTKKTVSGKTGSRMAQFREIPCGFFEYIKKRPLFSVIIAAVLAVCYGGQAFSNGYYIDSEVILNRPEFMYNWREIGRFGLVWLKELMGAEWFNPYLAGALFLITLWLTAMGAGYLFYYIDNRVSTLTTGIFVLIYLIYPTFAEQFMFRFQAFEVTFAMFLLVAASCFLVQFIRGENITGFLLSVPLLVFSFGIYQNMVNLQLCLYFGIFLFLLQVEKEDGTVIRRTIGYSLIQFFSAFLIYQLITKLFYSQSDYLTGQISWRQEGFRFVIYKIFNYVRDVFTGADVFYTLTYSVCTVFLIILTVALLIRKRKKGIWYLLGGMALAASPFFLTVLTGSATVYRAQMMLPLANALIWFFGVHCFRTVFTGKGSRAVIRASVVLGAVFILVQAGPLMRLLYTHRVIGQSDLMTASRMIEDLDETPGVFGGKPVVFIGHRKPLINKACYCHEEVPSYLCETVFEMDYTVEPEFYYSSHRILGYFETLGYHYARPTVETVEKAKSKSKDMVCWPLEGSVREFEDYVIVKMSD